MKNYLRKFCAIAASVLSVMVTLSACSLLDPPPTDAQALKAIQEMGSLSGIDLPPMFSVAGISITQCIRQSQPSGHVCEVLLLSQEIPILGVVKVPLQLRFSKRDSKWVAFLN